MNKKQLQARADVRNRGKAGVGSGRPLSADGSCCSEFLVSLENKLIPARRNETEKWRVGGRQRTYQYSRLQQALITNAFDAQANLGCHSQCLSVFFNLSSSLVGRIHRVAILRADAPTKKMTVSDTVRLGKCEQAVLPEEETTTRRKFFKSDLAERPQLLLNVLVLGLSSNGNAGKVSNRSRVGDIDHFIDFVKSNRSATGRTADANGLLHGAVYYLDPMIRALS